MEERLVTRDQEIKELKMVLDTKDEEIQRLRETATKRDTEVSRIKGQCAVLQAKDCKQYPSTTLRSESTNWKQKYDLKEEDVQRLKQKCALADKEKKSAIQQKNKELASQKEELEERLSKKERIISSLQVQNSELHSQLATKEMELQSFQEQTAELRSYLEAKQNELTTLQVQDMELQSQLATKEIELQSFQEQTAQLSSALEAKENELTTISSYNDSWRKYADGLNGTIRSAMDQLRAFEGEKSRQDSILGHLQQITNKSDELERKITNLGEVVGIQTASGTMERILTQNSQLLVLFSRLDDTVKGMKSREGELRHGLELKKDQFKLTQGRATSVDMQRLKAHITWLESRLEEQKLDRERTSSASHEIWIQHGEGCDELLLKVEDLLTNTEGTHGRLEKHLGDFDADVLLSTILQLAYDKSRDVAIDKAKTQLLKLFSKQEPSSDMEYTSGAYGMLMYSVGARSADTNPELIELIAHEVNGELARSNDLYSTFYSKSQPQEQEEMTAALASIVSLAWKLVTQPNPVIIRQPQVKYDEQIMDKQLIHWDNSLRYIQLVYAHPIVYRSYRGRLGSRGAVGNKDIGTTV